MTKLTMTDLDTMNFDLNSMSEDEIIELRDILWSADRQVHLEVAIRSLSIVDKIMYDFFNNRTFFAEYLNKTEYRCVNARVTFDLMNTEELETIYTFLYNYELKNLSDKEINLVTKYMLIYNKDYALKVFENNEIFDIDYIDSTMGIPNYHARLKTDVVLSKANFKIFGKISSNERLVFDKTTKSYYANTNGFKINELFEIIIKTKKYKQDYLQTILTHRIEGIYKNKYKNGLTRNHGGI